MLFEITIFHDRIIINGTCVIKPEHVTQREWERFCSNVKRGAQYE